MSRLGRMQQELRGRAELHLRIEAARQLGRGLPGTVAPYTERATWFWRRVFVPFYRRVPWSTKQRVIEAAGMTAQGWTRPTREAGTPWRMPDVEERVPRP